MRDNSNDPISSEIEKLQKPILGRRFYSWMLFTLIIGIFLILPIAMSVIYSNKYLKKSSTIPSAKNLAAATVDQVDLSFIEASWSPGQISSVHQPWENSCRVCHSTPFIPVQDQDCLVCHKNIGDHVNRIGCDEYPGACVDAKLSRSNILGQIKCASCHREHNGEFGLAEQAKRYIDHDCVACHENIKAISAATKIENVKDFATAHPEFRIQVNTENAATHLVRQRQNSAVKLIDKTSLKFPHDVHLAAGGVNSPEGKVVMKCANCHKPESDGVNFKPISMKENCQHCHALRFEMSVPHRQVPHGSVDQVLSTLREFYSYVSVSGLPVDRPTDNQPIFMLRPGQQKSIGSFIKTPGDVKNRAIAAATELFEKTSCIVCHEVTRSSEPGPKGTPNQDMPQWKITPIPPEHPWMPRALFDHSKHLSAQCTDCHQAPNSSKATDVIMPTISQCRNCHVGEQSEVNKVTSNCGLCHAFHLTSTHLSSVANKAATTVRVNEAGKQ